MLIPHQNMDKIDLLPAPRNSYRQTEVAGLDSLHLTFYAPTVRFLFVSPR